MIKPAPRFAEIAAQFMRHDIEWSRGAYMIIDRRTANPIARLRPILDTDRFELSYWSNVGMLVRTAFEVGLGYGEAATIVPPAGGTPPAPASTTFTFSTTIY
jgi:hypothetical protein